MFAFGGMDLRVIDCRIRLTRDEKKCIIECVIVFESFFAQNESEESTVPIETITLEEIQEVYNQIGIIEKTQQTFQPTELDSFVNVPVPTLYSHVPLVYSDSATI